MVVPLAAIVAAAAPAAPASASVAPTTAARATVAPLSDAGPRNLRYLSPDFDFSRPPVVDKSTYTALVNDIRAFIRRGQEARTVDRVSVLFRDLRGGPAFGIEEDAAYVPASLLKLPIIFTFFDLAAEQPGLLATKIVYSRDRVTHFTMPQAIEVAPTGMVIGESYSIDALMRGTIESSDNLSYFLLLEFLNYELPGGVDRVNRVFRELGVTDPRQPDDQVITVHGYASLFRLLFFASYLDAPSSDKLLSWLAASSYKKGLVAGVPADVPVAHKFGERPLSAGGLQLHDCGIVYFPGNPYQLCIMTVGRNWDDLAGTIAGLSRLIYAEVERRRR